MGDDRPVEDPAEVIAQLRKSLDDLQSTMMARTSRRPTGDIEPTIRTTAKPDTLLLQGQPVSRTTFKVLWKWVQDQGLVAAGVFGNGDGSTTFTLPDFRGRFLVGAGPLGPDTYTVGGSGGTSRQTLSTANLPAHDHNVSINSAGDHTHSGSTSGGGGHGGHNSGSFGIQAGSDGATAGNGNTFNGDHSHGMSLNSAGNHSHSVSESSVGSSTPFDARPPFIGGNWLIYT